MLHLQLQSCSESALSTNSRLQGSADKFRDLRSAAAVGTGAGTWDTAGQAGAVDEFVLFGRSMGLGQAAVKLQVSFALLL